MNWVNNNGHRTRQYWKWRLYEQFGLPWPEKQTDWHSSIARSYTQFRNSESGTQVYFIAEAGSPSPQLLIQISPFMWGLAVNIGDGFMAWRIGPLAVKISWSPMGWSKKLKRGFDTPWS